MAHVVLASLLRAPQGTAILFDARLRGERAVWKNGGKAAEELLWSPCSPEVFPCLFDWGVFQRRELDWQQERERGIGRGTYTGRLAGSGETWVSLLKRGAYPLDFVANYLGGQAL